MDRTPGWLVVKSEKSCCNITVVSKQKTEAEPVSVFISHRHIDRGLADVFREEISEWCDDGARIYQSSHAESGSKIGDRLDIAIAEAISQSNLVLLIYTDAPGDYDWCMYECGLAQDPASIDSNIAVFFTTEDLPDPMDNRIGVRLNSESIQQFVHDFHRTPEFFARRSEAFSAGVSDKYIKQKADQLHKKLKNVAPNLAADITIYDRITAGLDLDKVQEIIQAADHGGQQAGFELAHEIIPQFATVRSYSGDPQEHFNYDTFEEAMLLGDLFLRWTQDSEKDANLFWQKEICEAIAAAILNRPERSISTPFKSLASAYWLLPLLARFRVIPYEDVYEFDILFCKLESEVASRMLCA